MPSSLKSAESAIKERFNTQWAGLTPVAWPNVEFTPPTGTWVRLSIIWGSGEMVTMDGINEIVGFVQVTVFTPTGTAASERNAKIDRAREIFNRVTIAGPPRIAFGAASGPIEINDEQWYAAATKIPFEVEEDVV
jgi:hypothetical protein